MSSDPSPYREEIFTALTKLEEEVGAIQDVADILWYLDLKYAPPTYISNRFIHHAKELRHHYNTAWRVIMRGKKG